MAATKIVYGVNFTSGTVQERAQLNAGVQAKYDAVDAGESFEYCNVSFSRLSSEEIIKICESAPFRMRPNTSD